MRRRTRGAMLVLAAVAASAACLGLGTSNPVRAGAGIVLALLLPGMALRDLAGLRREPLENMMWALGLSVVTGVLAAVALDAVGIALEADSWIISLGGVTVALAIAQMLLPAPSGRAAAPARARRGRFMAGAIVTLLALGSVAGALAYSHHSASLLTAAQHFTEVWLEPTDRPGTLTVGLRNSEGSPEHYTLDLRTATSRRRLTARLDTGQSWERAVSGLGNTTRAVLELRRAEDPSEVYRRVALGPVPLEVLPPEEPSTLTPLERAQAGETLLSAATQDGYTLGSPSAPAELTIYASVAQLDREFLRTEFPLLLRRFVRPGSLRLVLRTVTDPTLTGTGADPRELTRLAQAVGRQDRFWQYLLALDAYGDTADPLARHLAAVAALPSIRSDVLPRVAPSRRITAAIDRADAMAREAGVDQLPAYFLTRGTQAPLALESGCRGCLVDSVGRFIGG